MAKKEIIGIMLKSRKITCPHCKAMIEVTNPKGLDYREITCPNPACKATLHVRFYEGETILAENRDLKVSLGAIEYNGLRMPLHEGKNSIGRKDSKNTADIGVETTDKSMSRQHCQIEVIRLKSGKVKPVISDLRGKDKMDKMPTMINGEPLKVCDRIVLDDGDKIQLGETVVKFWQK